jgi:hypothetical protein
MILTAHQPAYLPWLGYFHKINLADVFVFLDTTQFEKNSFINRNKIKTTNGPIWLTVPLKTKDHFKKPMTEIEIAGQDWREKHWKAIELNYKKSKYWRLYAQRLRELYNREYNNIADLCYNQLILLLGWLNIKTKIIRSSELKPRQSKKLDLVMDILHEIKASSYVSGALGRDYIDQKVFQDNNIRLYYQDYKHPVYHQLWGGEFLKYISIIDLLFNEGDKSLEILMQNNVSKNDLLTKDDLYEK